MKTRNRVTSAVLAIAALLASPLLASAQETATADKQPRADLAIEYNFVRSNAPPGGCTCFNLNGGSAAFALSIGHGPFAIAADVGVSHASSISSSGYDLTLSTFTGGIRYAPRFGGSHLKPFLQTLVGVAHSSGTLVEGTAPSVANSGAAFAANLGGGLDLRIKRLFSLRLIEADYLLTRFDNGTNNHQNNLRLGAGAVLRF